MAFTEPLLIIANSARMLAQSAQALGLKLVVIDCFNDLDTQQAALAVKQVACLSISQLQATIGELQQHYNLTAILYGSGFEQYPESLVYLAKQFTLLGNSPQAFAAVLNKRLFFATLAQLQISFPKTQFDAPHCLAQQRWLVKPFYSQGGLEINYYHSNAMLKPASYYYWQHYQPGSAHSVLFLATNHSAQIIGWHQQWSDPLNVKAPFSFAGIMHSHQFSTAQRQQITNWVQQLTLAFGLTGLNSLDFILYQKQCYVLEINARPPASMQLYSAACLGQHLAVYFPTASSLTCAPAFPYRYTAYQVVCAPQRTVIPLQFNWPTWCVDKPQSNTIIDTTRPICSIMAHAQCARTAIALVRSRMRWLFYQFTQEV